MQVRALSVRTKKGQAAPVLYKKNGVLALVLTTRCLRMATGRDRYSRARKSEGCRLRGTLRIVKTT